MNVRINTSNYPCSDAIINEVLPFLYRNKKKKKRTCTCEYKLVSHSLYNFSFSYKINYIFLNLVRMK